MAGAILTEADVRVIKLRLKQYHEGHPEGDSPRTLAQVHGVAIDTIRRIDREEAWAWVDPMITEDELTATVTPEMEALAFAGFDKVLKAQAEQDARKAATQKMLNDIQKVPVGEKLLEELEKAPEPPKADSSGE